MYLQSSIIDLRPSIISHQAIINRQSSSRNHQPSIILCVLEAGLGVLEAGLGVLEAGRSCKDHSLTAQIDSRSSQTIPEAPGSCQKLGKSIFQWFFEWFSEFQPPPPTTTPGSPLGGQGGLRPDYDTTRNRSEAKRDVGKRKTENPPHTPTGRRIFKAELTTGHAQKQY